MFYCATITQFMAHLIAFIFIMYWIINKKFPTKSKTIERCRINP